MTCNNFAVRVGRGLAIAGLVAGLLACGGSSGGNGNGNSGTIPVQLLAINVLSALVTPGYSLDGGAFDMSEYNDGNFILRSTASSGDLALLGSSHDANPASVRVVQDTYDVLFQREHGSGVPQNVNTLVQAGEVVNVNRALPVAVTSWAVTPTFQQNSAAFPVTEYDDGVFYLQPAVGGERIFLGNSHTAMPDAVQVMEGTYDVIYSLETGGDLVPGNQSAVVDTLSINADVTPLINVASVRFQLVATLDGDAFSGSQYE